ncbi:MAG TPA: N-acyl homoserine lactonase family protein [Gemmatimonadaceae bacterium]|nr:N-acyl homoserine lactonase family protein [Gemmatimonadaceae bacterium]
MKIALLLAALLGAALPAAAQSAPTDDSTYAVYAIRYATIHRFPMRALIAGDTTHRRTDLAMMIWLLRSPGHVVLVDAGFHGQKFITQWKSDGYVRPSDALARLGIKAADVTDIIVSHIHWDHADGLDLFPNARIWLQRDEYTHYIGDSGRVLDRQIDSTDAVMIWRLRQAGRVHLVDGDAKEILPGITVYTGGKHTYASQYAGVHTAQGTVVVASDNVYLYENLERHRPIAESYDSLSNLRAQARMRTIASDPRLIVPGHDPAVFVRFPKPGNGVARIRE